MLYNHPINKKLIIKIQPISQTFDFLKSQNYLMILFKSIYTSIVIRLLVLGFATILMACTGTQKKEICEQLDGKWSSVLSKCYRLNNMKQCIKEKNCTDTWYWANSGNYCSKIQLGMDKETVIFWLGNPKELNYQSQNILTWQTHKTEPNLITATFTNNQLIKFECQN